MHGGGVGATRPFTTPGAAPHPPNLLSPGTRGLGGALAREEQAGPTPDDQTGLLPYLVGQAATARTQPRCRPPRGEPLPGRPPFPWSGWGYKWPGDRHAPMMARGGLTEAREGQPPAPPQRQVRQRRQPGGSTGPPSLLGFFLPSLPTEAPRRAAPRRLWHWPLTCCPRWPPSQPTRHQGHKGVPGEATPQGLRWGSCRASARPTHPLPNPCANPSLDPAQLAEDLGQGNSRPGTRRGPGRWQCRPRPQATSPHAPAE